MRSIPLDTLPGDRIYKILCSLVVPRPIALVSTLGPGGVVNAAPFSFFNVFSENSICPSLSPFASTCRETRCR